MVDIDRRQMNFLGQIIRKEEGKIVVVTGFIEGKRGLGIQR